MKVISINNHFQIQGRGLFIKKANAFLDAMKLREFSKATVRSYAYDLVVFNRWLESQEISWNNKFTQKDLQSWMFFCKEKNLRPRSINRRLASIRMFYRFSYGMNILHSAGVIYSKGSSHRSRRESRLGLFMVKQKSFCELHIKVPKTIVDPLRPSDIDIFLRDIKRYRDLSIMLTMLLCGLRS